jgi:prolyl oligopeptidase
MSRLSTTPLFAIVFFILGITSTNVTAQQLDYPTTRKVNQVDVYHGVEIQDAYRWLEDMDDHETLSWVRAQEALTTSFLASVGEREHLESRLLAMQTYDNLQLPLRGGNRYFLQETPAGEVSPQIYVQKGIEGDRRLLLDTSDKFDPSTNPYRWMVQEPGGRHVAFHEGLGQSGWRRIHVFDVDEGQFREELRGYRAGRGNMSWTPDGAGFFYTRYEEPERDKIMEAVVRNSTVYYHELGTSQNADLLVFERPDEPTWLFFPRVTHDGRYLIITEASEPNTRVFVMDLRNPNSSVRALIPEADANFTFEASDGSRLVFRTTLDASNGRLVAIDVNRPNRKQWIELVSPDEKAVLNSVSEVGDRLVLQYTQDARPFVRIHSMSGDFLYDLELPTVGLLGGFADDRSSSVTFYRFNNLFDPGSNYAVDLKKGKSRLFSRPDLPFDPDDFELEQTFYESKDGTRVPMFVARSKSNAKDAGDPVFMYGYGAYKWAAFPWYQPHVLAWMEMGGVYAMPGIRGGGEYGEAWYQAGILQNKQNGIDDYIAAAEYLINEGYTTAAKLVANGGSASGVIAGAAIIQRPELFGAAVIDVPALDMLRFHKFGSGGNWIPEYGSPEDRGDFDALRAYSPYHNIKPGTCYPPTMTMIGTEDDSTPPMHGYKFVAAMQSNSTCGNANVLKVLWNTGHAWNLGKTPEQRAKTGADQIAFLVKVLGN